MHEAVTTSDFYDFEHLLGREERTFLEGVREFLDAEVRPLVNDAWEAAEFPFQLVPKFAEAGLVGLAYGEKQASKLLTGFVGMELSRVDPSMSTFLGVHNGLAMGSVAELGSEEQRERWLPAMTTLDKIGAFGLTEPHGGSDVARGLETTARRDGDEWVLDGAKRWIGNGTFADLVIIFAKDVEDEQVKAFVVEKDTPGFTATKIQGKFALRTVQNADIVLAGCRVPEANRLQRCESFHDVNRVLQATRGGVAWNAVGAQRGAYEAALAYAGEREQFGRPIAGFQLIQDLLARMLGNITASMAMAVRVAQLQDAGECRDDQAALAKSFCTSRARETVAWARELMGGNGILLENDAVRFFADVEALYSYEGTREINTLVVGRAITGVGAFV